MRKLFAKIYILPLFLLTMPVYAQDEPPRIGGGSGVSLSAIVDNLLTYLFPVAGLLALVFVIIGGYMWIISGGDPGRVKQAQGTLTWAILGLIVVVIIFAVLKIVLNFLS